MRRIVVLFGLFFALFFTSGCSNDDNGRWEPYPVGGLTMVNGYAGSNAVWYTVDGRLIQPPYAGLSYQRYDFARLFAGNRFIEIVTNQPNRVVTQTKQQIKDNQLYTSFLGGHSKESLIHFITEDYPINLTVQGNDANSGLRFFNLTGEDLAVHVKVDDQVVFENRNSETTNSVVENQAFVALESKSYTIEVQDQTGEKITKREQVVLEKGMYYTLILIGNNAGNTPYYLGVVKQF